MRGLLQLKKVGTYTVDGIFWCSVSVDITEALQFVQSIRKKVICDYFQYIYHLSPEVLFT